MCTIYLPDVFFINTDYSNLAWKAVNIVYSSAVVMKRHNNEILWFLKMPFFSF